MAGCKIFSHWLVAGAVVAEAARRIGMLARMALLYARYVGGTPAGYILFRA